MTTEVYSADTSRPIQQGDIFITSGVTRTAVQAAPYTPPAWAPFSFVTNDLAAARDGLPALSTVGGRVLVMVVCHDCHLDKEANLYARGLVKAQKLSEDEAFALAESDDSLDRHVIVSPVVAIRDLVPAEDVSNQALIRRGRLLGYFPLPDDGRLGLQDVVVDLGLRATVDRLTLTDRLVSLTDPTRIQLRYSLARMDSLRTPDIGHELDLALGQKITAVLRPDSKRATVGLQLEDGSVLELLPRPGDTPLEGPRRKRPPTVKNSST